MTTLVLASASPARLATLRAAGIEPTVAVSAVDEPAVLAAAGDVPPAEAVLLLARAKARDVAPGHAGSLVLGCDSMLELDGQVLGKPADAADAAARWRAMRGRSGRLHTGHWLVDGRAGGDGAGVGGDGGDGAGDGGDGGAVGRDGDDVRAGRESGATSTTVVHFADVTDAEIDAYVATGEPLWVAGAFTIDGLGGAYITGVEGDHHGVVGLSLPLLRELLAARGVPLHTLWTRLPS
ncbi:nucleoside triphosphate pyrophosphatase [Cellulomonas sp. PS-H5]|uniref:Maf family protein n=1 Tax=Cellulomonas sp. PS-H5 TaxID=2820400 RepID=UPI001C4F17DE|nr:nucleoside triphosphate pyrophosphatase [Cellulomonas sp. PS-H5]MBW0255243.1 Maf family protein [Cellulomonas sp. PS-H5]